MVKTTDISSPATQARPEWTLPVHFSFVCSKTDMFIFLLFNLSRVTKYFIYTFSHFMHSSFTIYGYPT